MTVLTQSVCTGGITPTFLGELLYRRLLDLLRLWHDKIEARILVRAGIELVANSTKAESGATA